MNMGAAFLHEKEVRFTIKRILLLAAVLVSLLYSVPAYAECIEPDFYDKLGKEAVNVIEDEDGIDIYALIRFHGALVDEVARQSNRTYKQTFYDGVESMWNGEYNGKRVVTHLKEYDKGNFHPYISVCIDTVKISDNYSYAYVPLRSIWLYDGDGRTGDVFKYEDMLYVSGHEFGHAALGLGDIYDDSNKEIAENLRTPMNDWDIKQATEADYYLLMTHETWKNRYAMNYSSDSMILKKYTNSYR